MSNQECNHFVDANKKVGQSVQPNHIPDVGKKVITKAKGETE